MVIEDPTFAFCVGHLVMGGRLWKTMTWPSDHQVENYYFDIR